jgi:6,7-dimethyl-8-ribityllumazine synthase
VASRFNGLIVEPLIQGALDAIVRSGGDAGAVTIVRCPGAWELPQVVRKVVARGAIDAVIALGAVIRGATPHFDYVAGGAASGIASVAAQSDVAVSFGVLTTDTIEQALERAGTKAGNKGFDAALAAIELATLFRALEAGPEDAAPDDGPRARKRGRGGS